LKKTKTSLSSTFNQVIWWENFSNDLAFLNVAGEKGDRSSGILLQFFLNLRIDIADSDTESVKLPVDEELKDSRPAINHFDCGVFLVLEMF
jgi:hypothetical protein